MADCGTKQGYREGCRCKPCSEAGQQYLADKRRRDAIYREEAKERVARGEKIVKTHGYGGYTRGCRCGECVHGYRKIRNERYNKRRDAVEPELDWSEFDHLRPGLNRPKK